MTYDCLLEREAWLGGGHTMGGGGLRRGDAAPYMGMRGGVLLGYVPAAA